MANEELRRLARAEGIPLWRISDALNVSKPTMTRKLRRELPEAEKVKIFRIIEDLKEGVKSEQG